MMRATEFEFKHRFWFIAGIFWLGFACYGFDHENAAVGLLSLFLPSHFDFNSSAAMVPLHLIFSFAALLTVLAAMLRTWAAAYLRSAIVHDHALHSEGLVADGPFRWMRNPLYDGGVLLGAGTGLLASRVGWFVMTIGLFLFYYRLVLREEAALRESQGESFRAYCAAVPRFLPGLSPRVKSSGAPPRWGQAFSGEIFIWGFAASVVAFAITLQLKIFWIVLGVSLAGYTIYWISRGRTASQEPPASAR
ncbi:MAG TPA: isoprenylcysteine carboxylmethyltransferase family protein [Candidatus Acidoferrum sp.]|nr:isoprenylcysteine carboxylmethyltransferase family protein [Candidatus Acidoferrum sp.]